MVPDSPSQDEFVKCFARSQARVYAYIVTLLPNRSDVEEVFQQATYTLWKQWEQYDPNRDFVAWACGIAHNEVRAFLRHSNRRNISMTNETLDLIGQARLSHESAAEDRSEALRTCLELLSPEQSRLIYDRYKEGESISSVAKKYGLTTTNLYVRLHRIRRALVECVEQRLAAEGRS